MKPWKRIEPTIVHKVGYRTIVSKTFEDNQGQRHTFDTVGAEGGGRAATIAITAEGQAIIVRQFRVGPQKILDELPGGGFGQQENPQAAAERELLEETGYRVGQMIDLGEYYHDAYTNETSHVFLATTCVKVADQQLDHEEDLEIQLISISQLIDNAKRGKMTDAVAVLKAYDQLIKMQEAAV